MSVLLGFSRLQKRFPSHTLFDIHDFRIQQGYAYMLTGANGAGKTTFLRILAGLDTGIMENFQFQGKMLNFTPYPAFLRSDIIYVHQHPILFSTSIAKNLAYGLNIRKLDPAEIEKRVAEAMQWAGLEHLRQTPPAKLSGGEKQRVAIARARILKPRLLLLDEPTANLDDHAKEQITALIPTLLDEGSSVLIASHDPGLIALPKLMPMKLHQGKLEFNAHHII